MIKTGFDLDKRDGSKRTALHIAAFQSHDEILKLLVEAGGDINALEYPNMRSLNFVIVILGTS